MLSDHTATILLFRDSALRRPIDVVAWSRTDASQAGAPAADRDNVIPMARFARAAHRQGRPTTSYVPPDGEAA